MEVIGFGYNLEIKKIRFVDELDMVDRRKRVFKDNFKYLLLYINGGILGEVILVEKIRSLI